jgi:hypothetical protein
MSDREPMTANLDTDLIDRLDERKRTRDARDSMTVSRSDVANEAIALGLIAAELIDDNRPEMHVRERRHLLRQALLDHFRGEHD